MHTETQAGGTLVSIEEKPAHLPAAQSHQVAAPAAQPVTPMDLLHMVTARGASVEEIGKFMDLMERQQNREAQQAFVQAMARFKKNAPEIVKDAGASFTGTNRDTKEKTAVSYDFATLGHICEKLIASLAEHGISHDWNIEQPGSGMVKVTCTLTHEQGGSKSTSIQFPPDPSGTKNALQAIGSSITYGQRYTLLAVCGIAVKAQGDDDGRAAGGPVEQAPAAQSGQRQQRPAAKTEGHPIDGPTLQRALAAIKTGNYTWPELTGYYALTDAQLVLAKRELNIKD